MDWQLTFGIALIVVPTLLEICLFIVVKRVTKKVKIITVFIWVLLCAGGVWLLIKETAKENEIEEQAKVYRRLLESELFRPAPPGSQPATYSDGLPDSPLYGRFFARAQEYEKESRFREAIEEYEKCLLHPDATEENRVAANILIGNCYLAQSAFGEAEKHYREGLDISKRVKNKSERLLGRAAAMGNMGIVLAHKGDLVGALENHRKALEINEKIGPPEGMAGNYGNIGIVLKDQGDLEGALENHRRALEINEKIGRPEGMANNYGNIGIVLAKKGDLEGALENHRKALEINEKIGRPEGMANNYGNIGIVLAKKGDLEAALENFAKVLEIEEKLGRPHSIANAYGNIGNVLSQKGDLDRALENYNKSLEITEKIGLHSISANQYINKANIHSQKNDYKAAALLELQALRIYSQIGMKPDVEKAQRSLAMSIRELKGQGKFEEFLREAKEKFGEEVAQRIKQITG